jgi:hypothetical protein
VIQIMLKRSIGDMGQPHNPVWEIQAQAQTQTQTSLHDKRVNDWDMRNQGSASDEGDAIVDGLRSLHVHHTLAREAANVRPMQLLLSQELPLPLTRDTTCT